MKNTFIKSTFILLIGGIITKLLGMVIKIIETRLIGPEGIGLFMMLSPTFSLFISLASMSTTPTISSLVAKNTYNNKSLILSIIPILFIINIILFIILFFGSNFIVNNLLHDERLKYGIISIGFVLPFISISSILRGYFFGKQNVLPHVISNIIEDIVRIIIIYFGVPLFIKKGLEHTVTFLVLSSVISEFVSIIVFITFLPNKINLNKKDFIPNKKNIIDVFSISIPTTISRFIGNIGYFLEPIILTNVLLSVGYSNKYIIYEYGILNGYVMPILLLPSFFTMAISQALIPVISKYYYKNDIKNTIKKLRQACLLSLMVGVICTTLFIIFPSFFLNTLYNTNQGVSYLRLMAIFFLLFYIQAPISSALQATGNSRDIAKSSFISVIIKTTLIFVLSLFKIGIYGLIISTIVNIIFVTTHHYLCIKKVLRFKE